MKLFTHASQRYRLRVVPIAMKLYCLPFAGASASVYNRWTPVLSTALDLRPLELPGRGQRQDQPFAPRLADAAVDVARTIAASADGAPFAIFGHSLGGVVAYEAVQVLQAAHAMAPVHLLVSGCRPPHAVAADLGRTSDLSDDEFKIALARLGGLPQDVLDHPRIFKKIVGVLRADYALLETYRHERADASPIVPCPLTAFSGREDREAPPAKMEDWARYTRQAFRQQTFDGGHFFLLEQTAAVLDSICQSLHVSMSSPADATGVRASS